MFESKRFAINDDDGRVTRQRNRRDLVREPLLEAQDTLPEQSPKRRRTKPQVSRGFTEDADDDFVRMQEEISDESPASYEAPLFDGGEETITRAWAKLSKKSKQVVTECTINECDIKDDTMTVVEPQNFVEGVKSIGQNAFEIIMVTNVFLFACVFPTYISFCFLAFYHLPLFASTFAKRQRLSIQFALQIVALIALACTVVYKIMHDTEYKLETKWQVKTVQTQMESLGFVCEAHEVGDNKSKLLVHDGTVVTPKRAGADLLLATENIYTLKLILSKSFYFEAVLAILQLVSLTKISSWRRKLNAFDSDEVLMRTGEQTITAGQMLRTRMFIVKTHELKEKYTGYDSDNKLAQESLSRKSRSAAKENRLHRENYKGLIKRIKEGVPRLYFDSFSWQNWSPYAYLLIIVFQLLQAMAFNGLIDIPALFMILTLAAGFAYRGQYRVKYAVFQMFFVYYQSFVIAVKCAHQILIYVPVVRERVLEALKTKEHKLKLHLMTALFGVDLESLDHGITMQEYQVKLCYDLAIAGLLFCLHAYRASRWAGVRAATTVLDEERGSHNVDSYTRWLFFIEHKDNVMTRQARMQMFSKEYLREKYRQQSKKNSLVTAGSFTAVISSIESGEKARGEPKNLLSGVKAGLAKYQPTIVLWLLRFLIGAQAYMYHSSLGLFHLGWVLFTFVVHERLVYFVTIVLMLPVYGWEFVVQYGMRTPGLKKNKMFQENKQYFVYPMESPVLEQSLTFIILTLLSTSVSCFKLTYQHDQDTNLREFFKSRIEDKNASLIWSMLYLGMRHLQVLVLVCLYVNGSNKLNSARNLGFMVFFTVYTASEWLYRRTNVALTVFISFFIFGQYYFSLTVFRYTDNAKLMKTLAWMNMYEPEKLKHWDSDHSIYFRHTPYALDYAVLLLMTVLNVVNSMYRGKVAQDLRDECHKKVRDTYLQTWLVVQSIGDLLRSFLVLTSLLGICYMLTRLSPSMFSWIFFILSVALLGTITKADDKVSTLRLIIILTYILKIVSVIILLVEIIFAVTVGQAPIGQDQNSEQTETEEWLQTNMPNFYWSFEFIGLRLQKSHEMRETGKELTQADLDRYFNTKFFCYVAFLVLSLFLQWHYEDMQQRVMSEGDTVEAQWKRIFEYKVKEEDAAPQEHENPDERDSREDGHEEEEDENIEESQSGVLEENVEEPEQQPPEEEYIPDTYRELNKKMEQEETSERAENDLAATDGPDAGQGLFPREPPGGYTENDLLELHVKLKFTPPYISYRWMSWWPFLDTLASYGHLLNSAIIVYIAVYQSVSFFMLFNLLCVSTYYGVATTGLAKRSKRTQQESGIQDQVDLHIARIVTKKYRVGAQFEFLKIRATLWKVQSWLLVIAAIISFPSTMMAKAKDKLVSDRSTSGNAQNLNNMSFWLFVAGLYKGEGTAAAIEFYKPYVLMFLALALERRFINWLTDRNGCTYGRFQKFVELETRIEQINARKNSKGQPWGSRNPPQYNVHRYANYYYHSDFRKLKVRFQETRKDAIKKARAHKSDSKGMRDFVPYTAAVRIKDAIQISVRIDGRAKDILIDEYRGTKMNIDAPTEAFLDEMDRNKIDIFDGTGGYDLEEIPIYREHKIVQLEALLCQAIDRKYKLSFLKGMQLLLESIILLVLMIAVVLKANFFSLVYTMFMFRFVTASSKFAMLVKLVQYIAVCSFLQYTLFVLNLNTYSSPVPFPEDFKDYPKPSADSKLDLSKEENLTGSHFIPIFFKAEVFRDLKLSYLLGVGIQRSQITNLQLDFLVLYLVSMYLLTYGNPLLRRTVKKIFWHFPNEYDKSKQWARLSDNVFTQVKWLQHPLKFTHKKYEDFRGTQQGQNVDKQLAEKQYKFALEYARAKRQNDLERNLVAYVDLRNIGLWNDKKCREKKQELKRQSNYFRLVKRGSLLIYLIFHVFTIMVILLMATVRASIISFIYVLILMPHFGTAAEVLTMRLFAQESSRVELEAEVARLEEETLPALHNEIDTEIPEKIQKLQDRIEELKNQRGEVEDEILDQKIERLNDNILKSQKELEKKGAQLKEQHKFLKEKRQKLVEMADKSGIKSIEEKEDERALIKKYGAALTDKLNEKDPKKGSRRCCNFCYPDYDDAKPLASRRSARSERDPRELWAMVRLVNVYLMLVAVIDFSLQIVWSLPVIEQQEWASMVGLMRVWRHQQGKQLGDFKTLITDHHNFVGLDITWHNFFVQILNCFIIATISLQREIFTSAGYEKFVTQKGGSMDLMVKMSTTKAEIISYIQNNHKVQKIIAFQRHNDVINATVEKLRTKLINWRMWTKSALDPHYGDKTLDQSEYKSVEVDSVASPSKVTFADTDEVHVVESKHNPKYMQSLALAMKKKMSSEGKTQRTAATQRTATTKTTKQENLAIRRKRIPKEEARPLFEKLAREFVEVKRTKLNWFAKFYLFLQENFINQVLLMQEKEVVEKTFQDIAQGCQSVPCELERLMLVEADELIRQNYESTEGLADLWSLLHRFKASNNMERKLLEQADLDKKYKLKDMPNTWAFTRRCNMLVKIFESLVEIFVSQIRSLIYLAMLLSMYSTAGLISIFYPIAVFGYAMLEETRPRKEFWWVVLIYTQVVLSVKFIVNLEAVTLLQSKEYQYAEGYMRLGLYDYRSVFQLLFYMMPEILIVTLIMVNEIALRLNGLHYQIEEDLETLVDGLERNQVKDIEVMKKEKIEKAHMNMARYFISRDQQVLSLAEAERIAEAQRKAEAINKAEELDAMAASTIEAPRTPQERTLDALKKNTRYPPKNAPAIVQTKSLSESAKKMKQAFEEVFKVRIQTAISQRESINMFAKEIWDSSREFEVHLGTKKTDADMKGLAASSLLRKQLENDNIIFIEGHAGGAIFSDPLDQLRGLDAATLKIKGEAELARETDAISAFDYDAEYDQKKELLEKRKWEEPGLMERSRYFARLFPTLRIQKPGIDFYGSTTLILSILAVYTFAAFDQMTPNSFQLLKGAKESSNLFTSSTALALVFVLLIIIVERFVNRSDTKSREDNALDDMDEAEKSKSNKRYWQDQEIFKGLDNPNQQTIRLQTFATANVDTGSGSAQAFLNERYGSGWDQGVKGQNERTRITCQQKCKYFMHLTLLASVHIAVFWLLPIAGNAQLYSSAYCDPQNTGSYSYGCFNFHSRWQLMVYYTLWAIYFALSSYQLRHGLPLKKVASSVFFLDHDLGAPVATIYMAIPFAVELRCLLDFTFSKTALDNFQFWQTYSYNVELYIAKWGNHYYTEKQLGSETEPLDKFLNGWLFCTVLMSLLIGPFLFFSDVAGFIQTNPVTDAQLTMALVINKTVSRSELMEDDAAAQWTGAPSLNITAPDQNAKTHDSEKHQQQHQNQNKGEKKLVSSDRSVFYSVRNPYLRQFDSKQFAKENFTKIAETKFFRPDQVQDCLATEYPDRKWDIDTRRLKAFANDLVKSLDPDNKYYNFGLQVQYEFERKNPPDSKTTKGNETKTLNLTQLDDCITAKQLSELHTRLKSCNAQQQKKPLTIVFTQAFASNLILGATTKTYPIYRNFISEADQKTDIMVTFFCSGQWLVHQSLKPIVTNLTQEARAVDPKDCRPTKKAQEIITRDKLESRVEKLRRRIDPYCLHIPCEESQKRSVEDVKAGWGRLRFVLFSMMASSSFLAAYSVSTFYIGITFAISGGVRTTFLFGPWTGFIYEITHPDALLRLCDGIYVARHELDLVAEEERYRMLQEIMRSPELLKALTGSSLKGQTDPNIDRMPASVRKKIQHLEVLLNKGYDVEKLKIELLKKHAPEGSQHLHDE